MALVLYGAVTTVTRTSSATYDVGGRNVEESTLPAQGNAVSSGGTGGIARPPRWTTGGLSASPPWATGGFSASPRWATGGLSATPPLATGGLSASPRWAAGGDSASARWATSGSASTRGQSGGTSSSPASAGSSGSASAGNLAGNRAAPPSGIGVGPTRATWRESEIVLTVDPSYSALPYAKEALEGALMAWTSVADQLPKVTLRYADREVGTQSADENLVDHRIFFAPFGDKRAKGALAITLVTADEAKNTILDGDILVNGGHLFTDVTRGTNGKVQSSAYDLQDVITHELGHWFGLDEDYEHDDATMYAYVFPGETNKRDLTQHDISTVQLAYWQADNPSENVGCSLVRTASSATQWGLGCLAVAVFLRQRRNRRTGPHVPARFRRLHP